MQPPAFFRRHFFTICLAITLVFAISIRIYNLTYQCLNVDEVTTAWIASHDPLWIIHYSLGQDYNPPLFYLIEHYSGIIAGGYSRFAVRFPAVIFGVLAIPVAYLIAAKVKNETLGLLVASLMAFMYPFYYYSQDARAYSLVLLAFLCFVYFWLKMWWGDKEPRTIAFLGAFAALSLWSHYYSLVPILALGAILLYKYRKQTVQAAIFSMLLLLPLFFFFDIEQFRTRTSLSSFNFAWATPTDMAVMLPNELFCWSWLLVVPLWVYSLYTQRNRLLQIFTVVSVLTIIPLIPLAHFTGLSPRYALLISPLVLMVAMYPVSDWVDNAVIDKKVAIFLLVMFVFFLFNYGSIWEWMTFNVCPYMTGTGAAA